MNDTQESLTAGTPRDRALVAASLPPGGMRGVLCKVAARLMLALFATVLALAAAEGLVRVRYPEYGIPVFTTKLFTEYDPLLGWRKIPNFHGTHVQEEYTIIERFNSKGLRGPEYSYEKPPGEYRILILGDSFAEGYTVEFEDLCSELLKKELNARLQRRVEVINAGTGGYGTDQELLFFRTEGRKYEPDLVVLLYCENDAAMNLKSYYNTWNRGQKPLFELVNGALSLKSTPQKTWDRDEEEGKDRARKQHEYKQPFVPWKPETWYLHRLCKHVLAHRSGPEPSAGDPQQDVAVEPEERTWTDAGYRGRQAEWDMTEALVAQIQRESSDIGAKFLLFNIPQKSDVHSPKPPDYAVERNLRVLSRRRDIAFIPTVDAFRKQAAHLEASGKRLYWKKDSHWTAEGHRLAARILELHLLSHRQDYGL